MTENFLLKLLIYQGRDWKISEDTRVSIQASLGKNVAKTTPNCYTSPCPKFNAELCWEVDRKTLRNFKLNRIPIKVEFVNDGHNCQKLLGYVILPLSIAAEGVEVHTQWYKILGGKQLQSKESPHILMALSLTDADDINELDPSSEEELDEDKVPQNEIEATNGYASHGENVGLVIENGNGYTVDDYNHEIDDEENGYLEEEYNSCEEEEFLDEENLEADNNDHVEEAFSDREEESFNDTSYCSNNSNSQHEENDSIDINSEHSFEKIDLKEKDVQNIEQSSKQVEQKELSESCKLLDSRSEVRNQLRRLSKEHISRLGQSSHADSEIENTAIGSKLLNIADLSAIRNKNSPEMPSINNKRLLDSSDHQNSSSKIPKLYGSYNDIDWNKTVHQRRDASILSTPLKTDKFNYLQRSLKNPQPSTSIPRSISSSVMDILLTNSGVCDSRTSKSILTADEELCHAELSEDNGFFRILPVDSMEEIKFLFSVTIIFTKNLDQVISEELWSKLRQDGLQFKYSLLGCSVFTDPFFSKDGHIELSERGTATVVSSESQLRKYFSQNSFLSVDLIAGNMIIASSTIDMDKLQHVDYLDRVIIEDVFNLSVGPTFLKCKNSSQASVGVCVELCQQKNCNKRDKIYVTKKSSKRSESCRPSRHSLPLLAESITVTSSEESDFEEELLSRIVSRLKWGRSKTKSKKLMHQIKKEKKDYLDEAAIEIDSWKEEQKQFFLKEWSTREENLQKHLATEWNSKVKIFEGILEQRLEGCSQLQDKLTEALGKLSIQETKLREKDLKVSKMEKELLLELKNVRSNTEVTNKKSILIENKKLELVQNEVTNLRDQVRSTEKISKEQMQEIFSLRRKLLEMDDIRILKKEKERLFEQLALTEEQKDYYKQQWTTAIAEVNSMHLAKKHNTDYFIDVQTAPNDGSNLGLKIRHLIEERKALTETGLYPHSHSTVREIDKKIKSLVNSLHNL